MRRVIIKNEAPQVEIKLSGSLNTIENFLKLLRSVGIEVSPWKKLKRSFVLVEQRAYPGETSDIPTQFFYPTSEFEFILSGEQIVKSIIKQDQKMKRRI